MTESIFMNETMMLGTFTLDGTVPVEPEIVLTNCQDTAQLGQLVSLFSGNPDIRFFLVDSHETDIDLSADFHFLKDSGNWVLANNNNLIDVHFDNADFNPAGSEATFSLVQDHDGSYSITSGQADVTDLPYSDQLLVDVHDNDLFMHDGVADSAHDSDSLYIDHSVLPQGENEIVVSNFTLGSDHLELPDTLSVKDVIVDRDHDYTEVVIGGHDAGDDIVVKLLGVSQPDIPVQGFDMDTDSATDDLISHLIHSGVTTE